MKRRNNGGFTVLELMMAVTVLATLSAIVTVSLKHTLVHARDKSRWATLQELVKATEIFKSVHGYYPVTCCAAVGCAPGVNLTTYTSPSTTYWMQYPVCAYSGGPTTYANIGEAIKPYISAAKDPRFNLTVVAQGFKYCSQSEDSYVWHIITTPENMHNYPRSSWNSRPGRCTTVNDQGQCTSFVNNIMIAHANSVATCN